MTIVEMAETLTRERGAMLRLAASVTTSAADAEDAVGEATEKALARAGQLRDETRVHGWLMTITYRAAIDGLRRRKPEAQLTDDAGRVFEPGEHPLYDAVRSLRPVYSSVLTLYYYEGYSAGEIAGMQGVSVGTVTMRLTRARKLLREILERDGEVFL